MLWEDRRLVRAERGTRPVRPMGSRGRRSHHAGRRRRLPSARTNEPGAIPNGVPSWTADPAGVARRLGSPVHSEGVPSRRLATCDAGTAPTLTPQAGVGRIRPAKPTIKLVIAQDTVVDDLMAAEPEAAATVRAQTGASPCL